MPQIFDVKTNENVRYKRNELEYEFYDGFLLLLLSKEELWNYLWCKGFCHKTDSELYLFLMNICLNVVQCDTTDKAILVNCLVKYTKISQN